MNSSGLTTATVTAAAMTPERKELLEEELLIVRHSGEIPEIALHASLYYLEEDEEGPRMTLTAAERQDLCAAALARAREIVLRDLDPANRDLGLYRGVARSLANWQRLQNFCRRSNLACPGFREEVRRALVSFLETELREVASGERDSCVNCSPDEIELFCRELELDPEHLPMGWISLCC